MVSSNVYINRELSSVKLGELDLTSQNQDPDIDRNSFEPAYLQLANIFKKQIALGLHRPGSKLPSEAEIRRRYKISPMTVRRAVGLLLDQGW